METPIFPNIDGIKFANVPGFPGYAASTDGRIWSCRYNRWGFANVWHPLRPTSNNKHGRQMLQLGRTGPQYVHHIILKSFVGPRPQGAECLHINGDASDNRLCNLRWGTRAENMDDLRKHGRRKGEGHALAKLTSESVREIRRRADQGETHQSIADRFGVRREAVSKIVRRERWTHIP